MVPRLGVKSATVLLDELNKHGVFAMAKDKLTKDKAAPASGER